MIIPRESIPEPVAAFAALCAPWLTPETRTAGFAEQPGQKRGEGDRHDLLATLSLFVSLAACRIPCSVQIVAGGGDDYDLRILGKTWNVKTSRYRPLHDGLHLCVKREEQGRRLTGGYIQAFVHLDEPDDPEPHLHIAGVAGRDRIANAQLGPLPGSGYPGVALRISELRSWYALCDRACDARGAA